MERFVDNMRIDYDIILKQISDKTSLLFSMESVPQVRSEDVGTDEKKSEIRIIGRESRERETKMLIICKICSLFSPYSLSPS